MIVASRFRSIGTSSWNRWKVDLKSGSPSKSERREVTEGEAAMILFSCEGGMR